MEHNVLEFKYYENNLYVLFQKYTIDLIVS